MAQADKKKKDINATSGPVPMPPIGKPISSPMDANTPMPVGRVITPPDSAVTPPPDAPPSIIPDAPQPAPPTQAPLGPAGQKLQSMVAQGTPQYHGLRRVLDSIAGATKIGTAIEQGGHFGTQGYLGDVADQQRLAGAENTETNEADKQQAAQASLGKTQAEIAHEQALTAATEAGMEDVTVTGPNGELVKIPYKDYASYLKGKEANTTRTDIANQGNLTRQSIADTNAAAKAGEAKYTELELPGGKRAPGKVNAQGNLLMADNTPAPQGTKEYKAPTYAEVMGGRITTIMVNGIPQQVQIAPDGMKIIGESGTGTFASRAAQASVVQSAGDQLIRDIQANKSKLGNMSALIQSALLGTPWSDPETQQLYAEIGSYIALHPAMHGFRGTNALEHFSNLIGGIPNNPDAMIAGIQGLSKMAGMFTPPAAGGGGGGGATQKFTDGGKTYNIPADQVNEFKKDHPNAR